MIKSITALLLTFFVGLNCAVAQQRGVTKITGDVYRFQNQFHFSVFVVTDNGVIVTDPINADAATWLRGEIAKLTDKPITHLIYSHSHGDHASGGTGFGSVPTVIAHANAPESIDGVSPTKRFDKTMTVTQGNKTIELTYLGPGHGTDLIAMVIRPENVAFVVDAVAARRLPYRDFPNADVDAWTEQVRTVEGLDFKILAGGHGPVGDKLDVTEGRIYMERLRAAVLAGLKAGQSDEELAGSVMMEKYKSWGSYDQWRALNVKGMARHLRAIGAAK